MLQATRVLIGWQKKEKFKSKDTSNQGKKINVRILMNFLSKCNYKVWLKIVQSNLEIFALILYSWFAITIRIYLWMLLELERNRERRMRGVWPRTLLHHHRPRSLVEVDLRFEYNRHSHLQRHPLVEQSLPQ